MKKNYVIGVDYGTDSCRALLVDASDGTELASAVRHYPRWKKGLYCDPGRDMYRQHPLDYTESLEGAVREIIGKAGAEAAENVVGIAFDTTGSTPVLTDRNGLPLALLDGFSENPDAMFVLWKDHTALSEADEINELAHAHDVDYTEYEGGVYSAEWVWAKVLHILRNDSGVRVPAYSWLEHSDWMAALLTGNNVPGKIIRNRCAAGHKAMWNEKWGGFPPGEFLGRLDPLLGEMSSRLPSETYTADKQAGKMTAEWAERLGLPAGIPVAVGALDAHIGAIGAGISPNVLTRIMGTSTCDILACPYEEAGDRLIKGICGQVDGSVLPGYTGLEAGQSAFGDVYAWFRDLLCWPLEEFGIACGDVADKIIPILAERAAQVAPGRSPVLALDWLNGRRTPDADQRMKGALTGLTLGTSAPMIFRALVEATAFGSKAIVERFIKEGIRIDSILAVGGIAQKSPFVMQTLCDVLGMPIRVVNSDQAVALGAAMCAATAAGVYDSIPAAQKAMLPKDFRDYVPDMGNNTLYNGIYKQYLELGRYTQTSIYVKQ